MLLQARGDIVQNGTRGLSEVCFVERKGYAFQHDRAFGLEVIFIGLRGRRRRRRCHDNRWWWRRRRRRRRRWRWIAASTEPELQPDGADVINHVLIMTWVVKACFDVRTQGQLARAGTVLPELDEHAHARFGYEVSLPHIRGNEVVAHGACANAQIRREDATAIHDAQDIKGRLVGIQMASAESVANARAVQVSLKIDEGTELFAQSQAVIPVIVLKIAVVVGGDPAQLRCDIPFGTVIRRGKRRCGQ